MKIVNATWELDNLGVTSSEINIEKEDKVENCLKQILELKEKYLVAKISSDNLEFINALLDHKFRFIETQYSLEYSSKTYSIPKIYERFMKDTKVLNANNDEIEYILESVKKGDLFTTDRISMDPHFGPQKSGNRFYNWMKSLLSKGTDTYIVTHKDKKVAFSMNYRVDDTTFYAIFGGLLPEFKNTGLGFLAIHGNMSTIYNKGGSKVLSGVSSNNMPILRLHILFGYNITSIHYALIKHL